MTSFRTIHTSYGLAAMASAQAEGSQLQLAEIAVGDGNGSIVSPSELQTALVRERFRAEIQQVYKPDPVNFPTKFAAEVVIPSSVGGFTMRELGIFDADGSLFAVGNLPETYKPTDGDGSYSDTVIRVEFLVSNADILTVVVDPNVIVATRQWVTNTITFGYLVPGGTTGQVLKKQSNADGDADWEDAGSADVIVSAIEEQQTLAASQTQVDLSIVTTVGLAVYIDGLRIPLGAGVGEWSADDTLVTRLFLGQSYPAGSVFLAVQNDPNANYPKPLERSKNLSDLESRLLARSNLDVYSRAETDQKAPPGMIADFAMVNAPTGWLKCNGAAIGRSAYAKLFSAIGTKFGPGNNVNTFNLPDFRGEFRRGWDDGRGVDKNRVFGSAQADEFRSHNHRLYGCDPVDNQQLTAPALYPDGPERVTEATGVIEKTGGVETRPRNIAVLTCIKF